MKPAASREPTPSLPSWRANLMLLVLAAWFIALAGRALWLQALNNDFLRSFNALIGAVNKQASGAVAYA